MKKDIQNLIVEGTKLAWESYKLEPYVQRCIEAFTRYNENVNKLFICNRNINDDTGTATRKMLEKYYSVRDSFPI
jgi:hypothetical protein